MFLQVSTNADLPEPTVGEGVLMSPTRSDNPRAQFTVMTVASQPDK
jgi:hypothetical protein